MMGVLGVYMGLLCDVNRPTVYTQYQGDVVIPSGKQFLNSILIRLCRAIEFEPKQKFKNGLADVLSREVVVFIKCSKIYAKFSKNYYLVFGTMCFPQSIT